MVSSRGIEVDKAKIEVIKSLPPPKTTKDIRSFLGHAGFYRWFIKDFSKISRPLCNLLQKEVEFVFDEECMQAFNTLKEALTSTPILYHQIGASLLKSCVMHRIMRLGPFLGKE